MDTRSSNISEPVNDSASTFNAGFWLPLVTLVVAAIVIFQPIVAFVVNQDVDYRNHLMWLQKVLDGGTLQEFFIDYPHFLYHLLVFIITRLFPSLSLIDGAYIITLISYIAACVVLYRLLALWLGVVKVWWQGWAYAALTLMLMLVMPINIITPTNLYLGYIVIHAYHNPTMVLMKPFAFALFYLAGRAFVGMSRPRIPIWLCAAVTVLCILAKPSFILTLLPALFVMAAFAYWRRLTVHWRLLMLGIILPAMLVLGLQAMVFGNTGGIIFSPLGAINTWVSINPNGPKNLLFKFVMSVLFPAAVYLLYFKRAVRNLLLNLAWLTFGAGAFYTYFMAEAGWRFPHANFHWSGQIGLLVLFVMSTVFFILQNRPLKGSARMVVATYIFALHLISGVYWYSVHLTTLGMNDIINGKW